MSCVSDLIAHPAKKKTKVDQGYAAAPGLAARLVGLERITRGPNGLAHGTETGVAPGGGEGEQKTGAVEWVTQSLTFEKKQPLHLVVKGVAKPAQPGKMSALLTLALSFVVTRLGACHLCSVLFTI